MTKKILSVIILATIITSFFAIDVPALNQRWHYDFENFRETIDDSDWRALYDCDIKITSEDAHTGSRSLKIYNRQHAWSSASLNLGRVFYEGGAGYYAFTVWVKVVNVATNGRGVARSIIRSASSESGFIDEHGTNNFGVISVKNSPESTWVCLQGSIYVESEDIDKGYFRWMLDIIDLADNQVVYIDDFDIFKASDNPNQGQGLVATVNDKPYEANYDYGSSIYDCTSYFNAMNNIDQYKHFEFVYTFKNESHAKEFAETIRAAALEEWNAEQWQTVVDAAETACNAIMGELVPGYGELMTIIDLVDASMDIENAFKAGINRFYLDITGAINAGDAAQSNWTISVHVLRHTTTNTMEYMVVRSDGAFSAYCELLPGSYTSLLGYLNQHVTGTTHNTPSINKIHSNYLYSRSDINSIVDNWR